VLDGFSDLGIGLGQRVGEEIGKERGRRGGAHGTMTSQETKWVDMAMALSCREVRFQGRERRDRYIRGSLVADGCPGERLYKVRVPRWFPIFSRQSRERQSYGAEYAAGEVTKPAIQANLPELAGGGGAASPSFLRS